MEWIEVVVAGLGLLATLLSALLGAQQKRISELKGSLEYERERKETSQEFERDLSKKTLSTLNDLIRVVESVEPAIRGDGSKTRDHVTKESLQLISFISGRENG